MSTYAFQRLSAQDQSFLAVERPNTPMHVAGVSIYRAGPLRTPLGGIDFGTYKRAVEATLHRVPRYRQKLRWTPLEGHPVWVDDRHFNLDYHVRHTSLPRPGTDVELKRKVARIMAQPLDLSKPLWENWLVEGLEGDRFALIGKLHHCMVDGTSGMDLAHILMSREPSREIPEARRYVPRPEPSGRELLRDAWLHQLGLPPRAISGLRELRARGDSVRGEARARLRALASLFGWAATRISATPLNGTVGPHRRFDWLPLSLDDVRAVRRALGCTVNDVVLSTVAGAVRRFLLRRHVDPEAIEFRVSAPVSVRRGDEAGRMGNRVSAWILALPIGEPDPLVRTQAIREATAELKESRQALGAETIMAIAEWTPPVLVSLAARSLASPLPVNLMVTNVPGPQHALYLVGCELLATYSALPLMEHTGLAIAVMSCNGRLCWGFNADRDLVPDLAYFVDAVSAAFEELAGAAGVDVKGLPAEVLAEPPTVRGAPHGTTPSPG